MGLKTLLLSTLAASAVQASQIFRNTGTTSGWTGQVLEHKGRIQEVTNIAYEGSTGLKFEQTYDPSYSGRYHSELYTADGYQRGDDRFYGFMFRLQGDWQFEHGQSYDLAQFIGNFGANSCDQWSPTTMVYLRGSRLYTRIVTGDLCNRKFQTIDTGVDVVGGKWNKVILQVRWRDNNEGQFKIWVNGAKRYEVYNVPTTLSNTDVTFQFRVGLYANGWYDDGGMKGTQPFRQVWYDEIAIGTTFADVDPDQW